MVELAVPRGRNRYLLLGLLVAMVAGFAVIWNQQSTDAAPPPDNTFTGGPGGWGSQSNQFGAIPTWDTAPANSLSGDASNSGGVAGESAIFSPVFMADVPFRACFDLTLDLPAGASLNVRLRNLSAGNPSFPPSATNEIVVLGAVPIGNSVGAYTSPTGFDPGDNGAVTNYCFDIPAIGPGIVAELWVVLSIPAGPLVDGDSVIFDNFDTSLFFNVTGRVFDDNNGNGIDNAEPGLTGRTVCIDINDSLTCNAGDRTGVTNGGGNFSLSTFGLPPRIAPYNVCVVVAGTETLTTPATQCTAGVDANEVTLPLAADDTGNNFGIFANMTISGNVYSDVNENGVDDGAGEPSLPGRLVCLDIVAPLCDAGPGEFTQATDGLGNYSFSGLPPAPGPGFSYIVSVQIAAHESVTQPGAPGTYTIANDSGLVDTDNHFGIAALSISGTKYEDFNADGTMNAVGAPFPADAGLAGWTIYIADQVTGLPVPGTSVLTGPAGAYTIPGLAPGTYWVCEALQLNWIQTAPNGAGLTDVQNPNDFSWCHEVTLALADATGINFGNFEFFGISGRKYIDSSGDGIQNGGEVNSNGWVIYNESNLTPGYQNPFDGPAQSLGSAGSGLGEFGTGGATPFTQLGPGTYTVCEEYIPPYVQTQPSVASVGSNPQPNVTVVVGLEAGLRCYQVIGVSGTDFTGAVFGNYQPAIIQGTKFNDLNGNGVNDAEPGLPNWTIFRDNMAGGIPGVFDGTDTSLLTDANGFYQFALPTGTYRICEQEQPGWTRTLPVVNPPGAVAVGPTVCYEVSAVVGNTYVRDFGNFDNVTIAGLKLNDLNGNGVNDADPGLPGWQICLDRDPAAPGAFDGTAASCNLAAGNQLMLTDGTGAYTTALNSVGPGTYRLCEVLQAGWTNTAVPAGGPDLTVPVCSANFTVASGVDAAAQNFLNFRNPVITGRKYNDLNGNGNDNAGADPGLAGWTIFLDNGQGVGGIAGDGIQNGTEPSDVTDAAGAYELVSAIAGTFNVCEVQQAGWIATDPATPPGPVACKSTGPMVSGSTPVLNFGNFLGVVISGTKFRDNNFNGAIDGPDTPLSGWTMFIDVNTNGTFQAPPDIPAAATDANGNYTFPAVGPGTYRVCEVIPAGSTFAQSYPGAAANNGTGATAISQFAIPQPGRFCWTFTAQSGQNQDLDFANARAFEISGHKFEDLDGDGVWDDPNFLPEFPDSVGEEPAPPISFVIYSDLNNNCARDINEPSTTTNADGSYTLTGLLPGVHLIREENVNGWKNTLPGGLPCQPSGDSAAIIVPIVNSDASNINFGNFELTTVTGVKFNDVNGNGVKDAGDLGLQNWIIFVDVNGNGTREEGGLGTAGVCDVPDQSQEPCFTTLADGSYTLALGPGTHRVCEVQQAGWHQTLPNAGTPNSINSGAIRCYNIAAASGTAVVDADFGNFNTVLVNVTKYEDLNGNGVRDGAEGPGAVEVGVCLDRVPLNFAGNQASCSGIEDVFQTTVGGLTTFTINQEVPAGSQICEVIPAGWISTDPVAAPWACKPIGPLVSNTPDVNVAFGNFELFDINIRKFEDANGDGSDGGNNDSVVEAGEDLTVTTHSFTIFIDNGAGPGGVAHDGIKQPGELSLSTPVGNPNGTITFPVNGPDGDVNTAGIQSYRICEELNQVGWTNTRPGTIVGNSACFTIPAVSGDDMSIAFGNFRNMSIAGMKFNDINNNGVKDPAELALGLAGWLIFIDANNNGSFQAPPDITGVQLLTPANGAYSFLNLGPNGGLPYRVCESITAGWTQTLPNAGTANTVDSGVADTGRCYEVAPVSGATVTAKDFGNRILSNVISGVKYNDINGDGNRDADGVDNVPGNADDEVGLVNWTIRLYNNLTCQGNPVTTTQTAVDGSYSFPNVAAGDYCVNEVQQAGWAQTEPPLASPTWSGNIQNGQVLTDRDFGNFKLVSVKGVKFEDKDGDGANVEVGEIGVGGWTIFADVNNNGVLDGGEPSTTTNPAPGPALGEYELLIGPGICNGPVPAAGTCRIREVQNNLWTQTYPVAPNYYDVSITSGATYTGRNFGNFKNITISGTKYNDLDGDGLFDAGEVGISGWTVCIDNAAPAGCDANDTEQLTNGGGNYTFSSTTDFAVGNGLGPGTYTICEYQGSPNGLPPADWVQTPAPNTCHTFIAQSGVNITGVNFFNFKLIDLSGVKWEDKVADGVRDADGVDNIPGNADDEAGLLNWTIFLDLDNDGVLDGGEQTTLTNANGEYSFVNLGPDANPNVAGKQPYRVCEVIPTPPPAWFQTYPNVLGPIAGEPSASVVQVGGVKCYEVWAASGDDVPNLNFGNTQTPPTEVTVTKTPSSATVVQGTSMTYNVTVSNQGPAAAVGVAINDSLGVNGTLTAIGLPNGNWSCSAPAALPANGNPLSIQCSRTGSMPIGNETIVLTVQATGAVNSTITNSVTVSASNDINPNNNTAAAAAVTITAPPPAPGPAADVRIDKQATPLVAGAGANITYRIRIRNLGPGTATDLLMIDNFPTGVTLLVGGANNPVIPAGWTCTDSANGTLTMGDTGVRCTKASLLNGQSATFTFKVKNPSPLPPDGTGVNQATVSTSSFDPNLQNNTAIAAASLP